MNNRGADFIYFVPQNFIFLTLHVGRLDVLRRQSGPQRGKLPREPVAGPAGRIERILRGRMDATQPFDFFEIASLDGVCRFDLQLAVPNQLFFPFAGGFERLFAIRDPSHRGFEGDLIGLMLQPQGRKRPFETLDLASLRHKRLALPRQIGLKGRQSVPLLGGERLCLSETGRELVDFERPCA